MPSCLVHTGDESVTLSAATVKRLLDRGDGDAALLYLALLRRQGTVPPRSLAGELRWDRGRIEAAETALRELGLVAPAETPPAPAEERPVYQRADVAERLEHSKAFQALTRQVEVKLGKKLTTPDVGILLGLTDYLGLPEGVVYLLVCHCVERVQRRFGEGRRPGMKQIEKEGYAWARMGIDTQSAADAYLRAYARRQGALPQYMRALQLGDRYPAPSEEKYLLSWQEMGFPPEAVALAYPGGLHDQISEELLRSYGVKCTFTIEGGKAQVTPGSERSLYGLNRFYVKPTTTDEEFLQWVG